MRHPAENYLMWFDAEQLRLIVQYVTMHSYDVPNRIEAMRDKTDGVPGLLTFLSPTLYDKFDDANDLAWGIGCLLFDALRTPKNANLYAEIFKRFGIGEDEADKIAQRIETGDDIRGVGGHLKYWLREGANAILMDSWELQADADEDTDFLWEVKKLGSEFKQMMLRLRSNAYAAKIVMGGQPLVKAGQGDPVPLMNELDSQVTALRPLGMPEALLGGWKPWKKLRRKVLSKLKGVAKRGLLKGVASVIPGAGPVAQTLMGDPLTAAQPYPQRPLNQAPLNQA